MSKVAGAIVHHVKGDHVQKSKPTSIRLSPEVKAAAEKAAKVDVRSLSSLIEKVLADHLREKGFLTDQEARR